MFCKYQIALKTAIQFYDTLRYINLLGNFAYLFVILRKLSFNVLTFETSFTKLKTRTIKIQIKVKSFLLHFRGQGKPWFKLWEWAVSKLFPYGSLKREKEERSLVVSEMRSDVTFPHKDISAQNKTHVTNKERFVWNHLSNRVEWRQKPILPTFY